MITAASSTNGFAELLLPLHSVGTEHEQTENCERIVSYSFLHEVTWTASQGGRFVVHVLRLVLEPTQLG